MKAYTDLEQSKKLAEILPLESADMWWAERYRGHTTKDYQFIVDDTPYYYLSLTKPSDGNYSLDTIKDIPCWSLAALLDVLPLGIYDELDYNDYELEINMIDKMPRYIRLGDISHSQFPWDFGKDTLIDNVVESIIWLNDNNYFEP